MNIKQAGTLSDFYKGVGVTLNPWTNELAVCKVDRQTLDLDLHAQRLEWTVVGVVCFSYRGYDVYEATIGEHSAIYAKAFINDALYDLGKEFARDWEPQVFDPNFS